MAFDPTDYTVSDLRTKLNETDDADALEAALEAEKDADEPRSTAIEAIEGRLNAVRSEAAESDSEDVGGEDDAEAADEDGDGETDEESDEAATEEEEQAEDEATEEEQAEDEQTEDEATEDEEETEPEWSFPEPTSNVQVVFDPTGAGDTGTPDPPISGHDTIHRVGEGNVPACGASGGEKMRVVARSSVAEDVDECADCGAQ